MRHIREVHRYFEAPVRCGLEGCPSTCKSYDSLRQHIYSKHKHILKCNEAVSNPTRDPSVPDESPADNSTPPMDLYEDSIVSGSTLEQHPSYAAAQYVLKTRDGRKLTQTTFDGILEDTRGFIEHTVKSLEEQVKIKLEELNKLSSDEIGEVLGPFLAPSIIDPFQDLNGHYKQEKFFQEHFNYVVIMLK